MEQQELNALIKRYLDGKATTEDYLLLDSWYLSLHKNEPLLVSDSERIIDLDLVKDNIDREINRPAIKRWPRYAAAAAFIGALGAVWMYFSPNKTIHIGPINQSALHSPKNIAPGSNKATLFLANGNSINLAASAIGSLSLQPGTELSKAAEGILIYKPTNDDSYSGELNRLETPKGGNYKILLPDGTRVWLNAASTLKYPTSFSSLKERKVELSGEAYFEVAKNEALPFRVHTGKQVVEVMGTHFNISSYPADQMIRTTLFEGRIRINTNLALLPGQQAINVNNKISVTAVDPENAVDWKNEKFSFNQGQDFESAMHQIERWYDVEFVYTQGAIPTMEPRGRLSRKDSLSTVLDGIQEMGKVHFRIEGRRVIVNN